MKTEKKHYCDTHSYQQKSVWKGKGH